MWPRHLRWQQPRLGLAVVFAGGRPAQVDLPSGWRLASLGADG